jgi:hypothetical protein
MNLTPLPISGGDVEMKGGKRRGVPVKTLKKLLKKAGLKTTGKKAALTRRAKQAHLVKRGGGDEPVLVAGAFEKAEEIKKEEIKQEGQIPPPPPPPPSTSTSTSGGRKKGKSRGKKVIGMYY